MSLLPYRNKRDKLRNPNLAAFISSVAFLSLIFSCFSLINDIGIYFLYLLPGMILVLLIQIILNEMRGDQEEECMEECYIIVGVISVITIAIFMGVFFGIFHPIHSVSYEKVENCQVIGMAPMAQASLEVYTILYVNFEYDNQQFLGQACTSDQVSNYLNYVYTSYNDNVICDYVGKSYDTPYNKRVRMLHSTSSTEDVQDQIHRRASVNQNRHLRERGKCNREGKSSYSPYNFSKIKMPSWMCMPRNSESFEEMTKVRSCYINFQTDRERSYNNSRDRLNQREVYFFALVEFSLPLYFPKAGLICLIIFTFYPINLFVYPLNRIAILWLFEFTNKHFQKIE